MKKKIHEENIQAAEPETEGVVAEKVSNFFWLALLYLFLYPLIALFAFSILGGTGASIVDEVGIAGFLKRVFLEWIFLQLMACFFFALLKNIFWSYGIPTLLLYLLHIVNYLRYSITGFVLTPSDLSLSSRLSSILSFGNLHPTLAMGLSFLLIAAGLAVVWVCQRKLKFLIKLHWQNRMLLGALSVFILYFGMFSNYFQLKTAAFLGVYKEDFAQHPNAFYEENGFLVGFYYLSQGERLQGALPAGKDNNEAFSLEVDKGEYSQEYMEYLLANIKKELPPKNTAQPEMMPAEKPNVIVILSEAFWDPTLLDGIDFSKDPIPNFHALSEEYPSGVLLSPSFGGLTCNVEYELLTGNPMYFAGKNAIPFEKPSVYIQEENPLALPAQFKQNGYATVAISPFEKSFYNRDVIYPRLGFERYLSSRDMAGAPLKGGMISDEYFTDTIIKELETAPQPVFLYGVSAENHYEYLPGKFPKTEVSATSPMLDPFTLKYTETYLQGLHDADKELGRLVEYLSEQERPTILFFFGDHLPIVTRNAVEIYERLGFVGSGKVSQWSEEEQLKMYTPPYLVWSNIEEKDFDFEDMSNYYIGPAILKYAGLQTNLYNDFVLASYQDIHGITPYSQAD